MKSLYEMNLMELKLGDILYEFFYGCYVKSEVIELPVQNFNQISWKSRNVKTGEVIDYLVTLNLLHYSPQLYDYLAYSGCEQV